MTAELEPQPEDTQERAADSEEVVDGIISREDVRKEIRHVVAYSRR